MEIDTSKAAEELKNCLDLLKKDVAEKMSELKKIRGEKHKVQMAYKRLTEKYKYRKAKEKQEKDKPRDQIF